jgi:flagellar biosynthesis protein FlhB
VLSYALRGSLPGLCEAWRRDAAELSRLIGSVTRSLGWRAAATFAGLGLGDLLYQRWRRARRLRMTRREVEHEQRETQGDPRLVHERRARGRLLVTHATLAELDSATLVITAANRAIALRYRPERDAAPVLWLKAEAALGISLVMRAHALSLPVHCDELLALDLYRLEPSQAIPQSAHERVAALLVDRA